jgi:AcrR family transcriptional regulator
MPKTKEQNEIIRNDKRELIRSIALSLFASKGYADTSIDTIAREAGISKGLLYHYFENKEHLLQYILNQFENETEKMLKLSNEQEVTDEEAADFVDIFFQILDNRRDEMKLYFQLSFQPQVMKFLTLKMSDSNIQKRQHIIIQYFVHKISFLDNHSAYFSILSLIKGMAMVYIYTDTYFSEDFFIQYKQKIKELIFKNTNDY